MQAWWRPNVIEWGMVINCTAGHILLSQAMGDRLIRDFKSSADSYKTFRFSSSQKMSLWVLYDHYLFCLHSSFDLLNELKLLGAILSCIHHYVTILAT